MIEINRIHDVPLKLEHRNIKIEKIEEKVIKTLASVGWNKSRCVNIENQIKILEEEGYMPFEYANQVIKSFDGLYISPER